MSEKYYMTISLNVLNHMGLNLYSNTSAVLAEVIANSWDADATEVKLEFDFEQKSISVSDNGCGMTVEDVNKKYLYVGYQKRSRNKNFGKEVLTPKLKRRPMGRKGIGNLSLFSIANKIRVYTQTEDGTTEAFLMDADKLREEIDNEDKSKVGKYMPEPIEPDECPLTGHGTCIRITDLKKLRLTKAAVNGVKQRIARRFSILGDSTKFTVKINGESVTLADRDYFHKARFIYQYGGDYARHCKQLEKDENGNFTGIHDRENSLKVDSDEFEFDQFSIKGWIAIAWRSNDIDGHSEHDNLNKINIVVRGKVAQEDILQKFRLGGMITKYMFGEIEADFLDSDNFPDIATSSRQSISEDDERYRALENFIHGELKEIWKHTNKLKEHAGLCNALASNPYLKQWHDELRPTQLRSFANKIFGDIDKAGIDESQRQNAYANGVMLFEHLKMNNVVNLLEKIDITSVDEFLRYLKDVDALEAEHYRQIVEERLTVIRKLRESVQEDAKERILQEYIFDHLFLLDPGWERATEFEDMEKRMEQVFKTKKKRLRLDIKYTKYRRVAAAHVIVELKRRSVKVTKTDLEKQVRDYMDALRYELINTSTRNAALPIEAVCIVGRRPQGWEHEKTRRRDEESLRLYDIRVVTYDELIDNAYAAYGKFLDASKSKSDLRSLIDQIRAHVPNSQQESYEF